ncbi:MmgE/PrpD family protein [Bacillota bacterium Lsc_1132]
MTLSKILAEYVCHTNFESLPKEVVEFTKICILDWYGSAIAGKDLEPIQAIKEMTEEWGGNEQASLITGGKSSIGNAILVNAAASHIVELDDIHKASIIHAGTVVIPSAVAVAEAYGLSGKELITAIVVGYEVAYRIGEAVSPSHYYYWHNTATCGTFGSAAAVAKLLNLNVEQTMDALGNSGSQAAGLWEFIEDGANTKQLHTAKAAYNGTIAALLAKKNFTAASKILEGRRGFFQAMSQNADPSRITTNLGEHFKITENSFKLHASCRHTHSAIDCILDIMNDHCLSYQEIKHITVKTYQTVINITDNPNPDSVYAAKFSLQFCVSLAVFKGSAFLSDFTIDSLQTPEILELIKKVEIFVDPYYEKAYPEKWGAKVEIETENGTVFIKETDYPKGDPEKMASKEELIEKFLTLTDGKVENAEETVAAIFRLDALDVREWFSQENAGSSLTEKI